MPLRLPSAPDTFTAVPTARPRLRAALLTGLLALLLASSAMAQSVGINTVPNGTAALDVASTTKGMLVPRLTAAQRLAIATPATGLLVFDTSANSFYYYTGTGWKDVSKGSATSIPNAFTSHATGAATTATYLNPLVPSGASGGLNSVNTFYAPESVTLTVVILSYSASAFSAEIGTVNLPPVNTAFTYGATVGNAVAVAAYSSGAPQTATITASLTAGTIYTMKVTNSTTTTGVFYTNISAQ